jgi:hypothetical protein
MDLEEDHREEDHREEGKPMNRYEIHFQPWDSSWLLSGPVGANGKLLFGSAKDAASHARWNARTKGGSIKVHDEKGDLFKTIEIDANDSNEDGLVLPSV